MQHTDRCVSFDNLTMTKLGPLTSQALGRSPYDIVVPGAVECDPNTPVQSYDEHGRPVNPETKRINRSIVRSHNEVMHAIGVAEPDSGTLAAEAEAEKYLKQQQYEEEIGWDLQNMARSLGIVGIWGLSSVRQRVLLYREYSGIPFHQLFRYERSRQSPMQSFLAGIPTYVMTDSIFKTYMVEVQRSAAIWKRVLLGYVWRHLQYYVFMQRLRIAPAVPWLPGILFFIPFSRESPFQAPPPLSTPLTIRSAALWLGKAAIYSTPLFVFTGYTMVFSFASRTLYNAVLGWLPSPSNATLIRILAQRQTDRDVAREPIRDQRNDHENVANAELQRRPSLPTQEQQPTLTPAPAPPTPGSSTTVRRRNTMSSQGGDDAYGSEEEEFNMNTTLISFDVETTEAPMDAPSNTWHAELRQSTGIEVFEDGSGDNGDGDGNREGSSGESRGMFVNGVFVGNNVGPVYSDNMLTRLPVVLATDMLTESATTLLVAPLEAVALRAMAHLYRSQHGRPTEDLFSLNVLSLVSLRGGAGGSDMRRLLGDQASKVVGLVLLHLLIKSVSWLAITGLAALYRGSTPGSTFLHVVREKLWGKKTNKDTR